MISLRYRLNHINDFILNFLNRHCRKHFRTGKWFLCLCVGCFCLQNNCILFSNLSVDISTYGLNACFFQCTCLLSQVNLWNNIKSLLFERTIFPEVLCHTHFLINRIDGISNILSPFFRILPTVPIIRIYRFAFPLFSVLLIYFLHSSLFVYDRNSFSAFVS